MKYPSKRLFFGLFHPFSTKKGPTNGEILILEGKLWGAKLFLLLKPLKWAIKCWDWSTNKKVSIFGLSRFWSIWTIMCQISTRKATSFPREFFEKILRGCSWTHNSVNCYVKISWSVSFSCVKQFYCWFCFIRVLARWPEAGRNFSTPRPTFLGGYKVTRGVKTVKNTNFLITWPILAYDSSFSSAQRGEQLSFETFFSKFNIYPSGGGNYPQWGKSMRKRLSPLMSIKSF